MSRSAKMIQPHEALQGTAVGCLR